MPERVAHAHWEGAIKAGHGSIRAGSGVFDSEYSFGSRFEDRRGTNPEELFGAAHAGCFTMALALGLSEDDHPPTPIDTTARVAIEREPNGRITHIALRTEAGVPGIDAEEFQRQAETAKVNCPVSRALAGTEIELEAQLLV
jgi:osmotically inducible protein OsmC